MGGMSELAAPVSVASTITSLLALLGLMMCVAAAGRSGFPSSDRRSWGAVCPPRFDCPTPKDTQNNNFLSCTSWQKVDHFDRSFSSRRFLQRYYVNTDYWSCNPSRDCAIVVYLGGEGPIVDALSSPSFTLDMASLWRSIVVFIEHRYYGKSLPFGQNSTRSATELAYLTVEQAMEDVSVIIEQIQTSCSASRCPVIAIGSSYSGMLAAWMHLKYPHRVYGALASSAPVLYGGSFTPARGFYDVVSYDFYDTSSDCYWNISASWGEIDQRSLTDLSNIFNVCRDPPLKDKQQISWALVYDYTSWALFDSPLNPQIFNFCNAVASWRWSTDILQRIRAGLDAVIGAQTCYKLQPWFQPGLRQQQGHSPWDWQKCHELIMPLSNEGGLFLPTPWDVTAFLNDCNQSYGVPTNITWKADLFGSYDSFIDIFQRGASRIIFYNGLRDPYSDGGIQTNLSRNLIAINSNEGSHGLDVDAGLTGAPYWLWQIRKQEFDIIDRWVREFHSNPKGRSDQ